MRIWKVLVCLMLFFESAQGQGRGLHQEQLMFEGGRGDVFAVVVGISDYASAGIRNLSYAHRDAQAFAAFLRSDQGGRVPSQNILLLVDAQATYLEVRSALLDWLPQRANRKDHTAIVFFAGHGVLHQGDPLFLVRDTDPQRLGGSGLPMDVVQRSFERVEADRRLFFSDACHSGAIRGVQVAARNFSGNLLTDRLSGRGRVVIASSRDDENSYESDVLRAGFFTHYLLEGLKGAADRNGDGYVDVHEAYEYLYGKVADAASAVGQLQHPRMGGELDGVVLLSHVRPGEPGVSRGTVRVQVNAAATIYVDGQAYGQVSAGQVTSMGVSAGERVVRVEAVGYAAQERTVQVVAGGVVDVNLALAAISRPDAVRPPEASQGGTGALYIRSEPAGASVSLDGRAVGETPLTTSDLAVGLRRLRLELDMYHSHEEVVQVESGVKWLEVIPLRPAFGSVRVDSEPSGALLYLDGRQVGRTPFSLARMKSGRYGARLVLDWYHDWDGTVVVQDGEAFTDKPVLRPAFGSLVVRSEPSGARVLIDGQESGVTPLDVPRVRSGSRVVRVEKELYGPYEQSVMVSDGQKAQMVARLDARFGGIAIQSRPAGMPVEVDGRAVGQTPVTVHPVGVGTRRVVIGQGLEGYRAYEGAVEVRPNETLEVFQELLPRLGNVTVYSEPPEGVVYIGGERKGIAPVTVRGLLAGAHKIKVEKEGLIYEGDVRIREGLTEELRCKLVQPFRGGEMVHVSDFGFYIDKYPVTNAQYAEFVRAKGHQSPESTTWGKADWNTWRGQRPPSGMENHPVVGVSWEDARSYCKWAEKRLPTEEEWQQACQGRDGRTYPWGNASPSSHLANYGHNVGQTTEVGKYPSGASPYGALDMSGNVWEWTESISGSNRVVRGGSWFNDASYLWCAYRNWYDPVYRYDIVGFRCARTE